MLPLLLVLVADPELLLRMGSAAGAGGGAEDSSKFSIVAGAYHSARDMESNRTRPYPERALEENKPIFSRFSRSAE